MINQLKKFKNKKVLITGHTGFKGSWLAIWLIYLGAEVVGVSNNIPTKPSNFLILKLKKKLKHRILDIRNYDNFKKLVLKEKPDFIFHLAAQSLVKKSYIYPRDTFETNSLGILNLLEILNHKYYKKNSSVVIITSDKSYKNLELERGYKENDILGGHDPYSASKACAEILIQSYVKSFLNKKKNLNISIARAGNVIGGGDWSTNRLIPDCVRSISNNKKLMIRFPNSTRPWQHVLEALYGYMILALKQKTNKKINGEAFNFGPKNKNSISVIELIKIFKKNWATLSWQIVRSKKNEFESKLLKLNSNKAYNLLNWKCNLTINQTIYFVINWYRFFLNKNDMYEYSIYQIKKFESIVKRNFKKKKKN